MAESEVVKAIRKQREEIARNERDTLRRMARLWVPSYKYLEQQVNALTALIQQKRNKGEQVEIEYLHSLDRYKKMMAQAKQMIRDYNKAIAGQIRGTEAEMVDIGHQNAKQIVSIAEPDDPLWTRVNKRETRIMAAMTAEESPLDKLLNKSFGQMKEGMEQALITGISTGQGSSWIAQQLMKAAEIPEQRALLIARTEVNRTYRQSNWEQMRSSRAIRGYRRMCYPETACFACLMLDGEFYPIDSEPCDHPNGKCSFVPVTRHFDPANDPNWQRGRDWFIQLDPDTQRKLMGPGRFELWKTQGVDPRDMVYIKPNDIWGGSPAMRSLSDLYKTYSTFPYSLSSFSRSMGSSKKRFVDYVEKDQNPEDIQKFEELSRRVKQALGIQISQDVKSLDYDSVSSSIEAIIDVTNLFPELKKVIKGIESYLGDNLMETSGDGILLFNKLFYGISTKTNLQREIEETKKERIKNSTEKTIAYHEAGHLISILLGYKKGGSLSYAAYTYKTGEIAQTVVREAVKIYNRRYNTNKKWADLAKSISTPALRNQNETFAECVADYMTNRKKATRFSKIVWEIIERELE